MLKKLFFVFAITVAVLLLLYWIYFPSVSRYRELKLEEEKLTKRIEEIDSQIKALSNERNLLQTDATYLEKVIREELGFVKPGEIVYELITRKNPSNPEPAAVAASPANSEAVPKVVVGPEPVASGRTVAVKGKIQNTALSSKGKIVAKSI